MKNQYVVYKATSPSSKSYVGVTNNFKRRKAAHHRAAENGSLLFFHTAIRKYGAENFKWEILLTSLTEEEAFAAEIRLIQELQLTDKEIGYNLQKGGEHFSWTDEIRGRHKAAVNTPSCKAARKEKYTAKLEKTIQKMSQSARNRSMVADKSFYAYNPESEVLIKFSALFEVKERLNLKPESVHIALSGKSSYYKGLVFRYSDAVVDLQLFKAEAKELVGTRYERLAMTRAKASGIRATHKDTGEVREYKYIRDFQLEVNGSRSVINSVLNKVKPTYKGWILDYIPTVDHSS
jgi:predicted GIY-YIG superfamily endonuclease